MDEEYFIVCIYTHIFFIYSFMDGHLRYFHILVIMNTAAVNMGGVQISVQDGISFPCIDICALRRQSHLLVFLSSPEGLLTFFSALLGCRICSKAA